MARIFLLGAGPLADDPRAASAAAFRSTQFVRPLLEDGHEVFFAELAGDKAREEPELQIDERLWTSAFSPAALLNGEALEARVRQFQADAVCGCGTLLPAYAAARLRHAAPVWADLNGDPIAELQIKAAACPGESSDIESLHVWKLVSAVYRWADRISTVSEAQAQAALGCLGLLGRLGAATASEPLVHSIPNGLQPRLPRPQGARNLFRGARCPQDSFLIAWSGSYNTWVDDGVLLRGLLGAMERDGRIRFVSTGGGSQGYNEGVYERFRRAALASPFAARFHFLGWLGRDEAEAIHAECDVGISLDRWCAEAVLGARNRLVNWLDLGLPAASTAVCEAARLLAEAQGMIELPLGDAEAVAAILAALPGQPQRLRETLRRGQAHVRQRYGFRQVMAPLLEWARAPRRAGDFRQPSAIAAHADFETLARERDRLAAEVASLSDRKQWLGRFRQAARRRLFGEE